MSHIINLAVQAFLFHNTVRTHELKLYDDLEQRGVLSGKEEVARKLLISSAVYKSSIAIGISIDIVILVQY